MAVYVVTREGAPEDEKPRMVEARNQAAAIAHVARSSYAAMPISTATAVKLSKEGVELEDPKAVDGAEAE